MKKKHPLDTCIANAVKANLGEMFRAQLLEIQTILPRRKGDTALVELLARMAAAAQQIDGVGIALQHVIRTAGKPEGLSLEAQLISIKTTLTQIKGSLVNFGEASEGGKS